MCYMSEPVHWPSFLRQVCALEASWNTLKVDYPRDDAVHFLPLPIPQFISMLTDAVMAAPTWWGARSEPMQTTFIDVGCGTGTKLLLAQALFDVAGCGIDIVPEFIAAARQSGLKADLADAFEYETYDVFDIVFANRPSTLQDELEKLICDRMRPGAVLMAANWRHDPQEYGFEVAAMEYERPVCGVFRKLGSVAGQEAAP